jgi:hypothetical protein
MLLMILFLNSPTSTPTPISPSSGFFFLRFVSTKKTITPMSLSLRAPCKKRIKEEGEDDSYGSDDNEHTSDNFGGHAVGTNVRPTVLAYWNSKQVHIWACVDRGAEAMGNREELLARFGSCSTQISSTMGHLSSIQTSCHRASASFESKVAHQ